MGQPFDDSAGMPRSSRSRGSSVEKFVVASWVVFIVVMLGGMALFVMRIASSEPVPGASGRVEPGQSAAPGGPSDPPVATAPATALLPDFTFSPEGVFFTPSPFSPEAAPTVQILKVPEFAGFSAIWGASGRDHRGHVWFGVSTRVHGEAHLVEFNPDTKTLKDHGSVRDQLKRLSLWKEGMSQIKIHSRIVQAPDGYLYFASMDEQGEASDGSKNPTHGSYLWRTSPTGAHTWERIATIPQGLIAVSCSGHKVYALGYHGHILYQYDTKTGSLRSLPVGSVAGHISRNFVTDGRDHVYVPQLEWEDGRKTKVKVSLVEFDADLREIASTPLRHYLEGKPADSHGIIGLTPLADGSIIFTTHGGLLYRINPPGKGFENLPAQVSELGFLHPQGSKYIATLFTYDGKSHVMGISQNGGGFEWVIFDLKTARSLVKPLTIAYPDQRILYRHLLYGSVARDRNGACFVVGTDQQLDQPVVLRLLPPS